MKIKTMVATACTVLCIGTALSVPAFAEEAKPIEREPVAQSATVFSDGLKEGLKSGLKNGLKNGTKDGMKNGLKDGLKNGEKR